MRHPANILATAVVLGAVACGGGRTNSATTAQTNPTTPTATQPGAAPSTAVADTAAPRHHSVLAGAALGAAAGHALGRHAVVGAAAGALLQHERNKHHP